LYLCIDYIEKKEQKTQQAHLDTRFSHFGRWRKWTLVSALGVVTGGEEMAESKLDLGFVMWQIT
jgi:hypothetical protein